MNANGMAALLLCAVLARPGDVSADPPTAHARLLDGAGDEIVRRAFVPRSGWRQGEVRLVRRGDAAVMQTVLSSAFLRYVIAEIRRKEAALWPPERDGHADSVRYVEALGQAQGEIERRVRGREARGERRQKMVIEFILTGKASIVALYEAVLAEDTSGYRIASKRPLAVIPLSRTYVRGDIHEIARDALGLDTRESAAILAPLLPKESE